MPERDIVLLDACSLINLYATRRIDTILAASPDRFGIVDIVKGESGYVLRGGVGSDANDREPIDLLPLERAGLLTTLSAETDDELRTYVELKREMDDGESMTGAVAIHRGHKVITDDLKALRVLGERGVTCGTSLDLIKGWAEHENISRDALPTVLLNVRQRARYTPHRGHHLRAWWDELMS